MRCQNTITFLVALIAFLTAVSHVVIAATTAPKNVFFYSLEKATVTDDQNRFLNFEFDKSKTKKKTDIIKSKLTKATDGSTSLLSCQIPKMQFTFMNGWAISIPQQSLTAKDNKFVFSLTTSYIPKDVEPVKAVTVTATSDAYEFEDDGVKFAVAKGPASHIYLCYYYELNGVKANKYFKFTEDDYDFHVYTQAGKYYVLGMKKGSDVSALTYSQYVTQLRIGFGLVGGIFLVMIIVVVRSGSKRQAEELQQQPPAEQASPSSSGLPKKKEISKKDVKKLEKKAKKLEKKVKKIEKKKERLKEKVKKL